MSAFSTAPAIGTPKWTFPSRGELVARGRLALRLVEAAQQAVEHLPLGTTATRWSDQLTEERGRLERVLNLSELYGVYVEVDSIFDTRNLLSLWERLPEAERRRFGFDPAGYDWSHYLQDVHLPTVVRMARADTGASNVSDRSASLQPRSQHGKPNSQFNCHP